MNMRVISEKPKVCVSVAVTCPSCGEESETKATVEPGFDQEALRRAVERALVSDDEDEPGSSRYWPGDEWKCHCCIRGKPTLRQVLRAAREHRICAECQAPFEELRFKTASGQPLIGCPRWHCYFSASELEQRAVAVPA